VTFLDVMNEFITLHFYVDCIHINSVYQLKVIEISLFWFDCEDKNKRFWTTVCAKY